MLKVKEKTSIMPKNFIGVLSGGAGTRLWPLSREEAPKQFYALGASDKPLIIDTLSRLKKHGDLSVITTQQLSKSTIGIAKQYGINCKLIGEPQARNTAPAVALFTWLCLKEDSKACIGLFPADHIVKNEAAFDKALEVAFAAANTGKIVTLGIQPTYPSDGYGYILLKEKYDASKPNICSVDKFIEKPAVEKAKELIAGSSVVWNAGMFIFSAQTMADKFKEHMPKLWSDICLLKDDLSNLDEIYTRQEKISIDYGIMEKLSDIYCVPADIGWTDVGNWEEISENHTIEQNSVSTDSKNNYHLSLNTGDKKIAYVGVEDLITVDTPDALLVLKRGEGQKVRDIVTQLKESNPELIKQHKFEVRPWGRFEVLLDTEYFKSKRITVHPGQKLSYQSHKHRSEHWVVVKGTAEVTLDGKVLTLNYGENVYIPLGAKHRMANPGTENMEIIEVQVGNYFGEDDIIRYEDDYGRS